MILYEKLLYELLLFITIVLYLTPVKLQMNDQIITGSIYTEQNLMNFHMLKRL